MRIGEEGGGGGMREEEKGEVKGEESAVCINNEHASFPCIFSEHIVLVSMVIGNTTINTPS